MHLLITGGCGFIGANLVRRLDRMPGVRVRVFDNESMGHFADLPAFRGEFIRGDIRNRAALSAALEGIDAVVNLAADTRVIDSIENPALNFDVNVVGGFNLLEAMRAKGIRRLIHASTGGAILGDVAPPVHEDMVARPLSPYGASKLMMEGYCSAYSASYGFEALCVRFSNVYGPGSLHKGSVVAAFFKRLIDDQPLLIYGDGQQARDFIFIEDLCDGIVQALDKRVSGVIQLGSGRPVTVNQLIEEMQRVTAPQPLRVEHRPARPGEVLNTWCDIDKARRDLGFNPATSLACGLAETWRWFMERHAEGLEDRPLPRATLGRAG